MADLDKIIAYKDIIEDYINEERNLQSFIINTKNTRPDDIYIIIYILYNFFNYSSNVKEILKEIEIKNERRRSFYKCPRKYKYRTKGRVWNYRKCVGTDWLE